MFEGDAAWEENRRSGGQMLSLAGQKGMREMKSSTWNATGGKRMNAAGNKSGKNTQDSHTPQWMAIANTPNGAGA